MPQVLVSSAGRRVEMINLFAASLQQRSPASHVIAADVSPLAPALYGAARPLLVPQCTDGEFIDHMMSVCREHGVGMIVPTIDTELPVYALASGRFREVGCRVVVSSPETICITNDKRIFHSHLRSRGLPTVTQVEAFNADQVRDVVGLPCIVKPARGSSSIGQSLITDLAELQLRLGEGMIAESVARGDEYTVDVLVDATGQTVSVVPRRRIAVRAGEVSKAVTESAEDVSELARQVVATLPGAVGPLCVQIFRDSSTGELNVIEVNARFGGGFPLTAAAGANFADYLIAEVTQSDLPSLDWRPGVTMLRFDNSVFLDQEDLLR